MEHMGQHALSVPVGGGQTSNLLSQWTYVSLKDYSPLDHLIPVMCQLSHPFEANVGHREPDQEH
jgi:hypothetical protein